MTNLGLLLLTISVGQTPKDSAAKEPMIEINQDFAQWYRSDKNWVAFGPNVQDYLFLESQGLRITLPASETPVRQVGLAPKIRLHGDFEVTLTYDILELATPTDGYGSGLNLVIDADYPDGSALLGRRSLPNRGDAYATDHKAIVNGKETGSRRLFPTKAKSGTLCLTRVGKELIYLVAEEPNQKLKELRRGAFPTYDLVGVRVVADPGGSKSVLDVRIKTFRCRIIDESTSGNEAAGVSWTMWLLVGTTLAICAGAARFVQLRRRRRLQTELKSFAS